MVSEALLSVGTTGEVVTVMVTDAVEEQLDELVPVTVYVVVEDGVATTDGPVVAFSPVDGDQL